MNETWKELRRKRNGIGFHAREVPSGFPAVAAHMVYKVKLTHTRLPEFDPGRARLRNDSGQVVHTQLPRR